MKLGSFAAAIALIMLAAAACAQRYPVKPVRIVTVGVGGGSDFVARLVAQGLTVSLGQQVIVENRAAGVVPGAIVSQAPPDGYTLLVSSGILWITPLVQDNVPFDPVRDFAPITMINMAPNLLVVHPAVPAKSVGELIAYAKSRSAPLNYASVATGSSSHLSAELFRTMAGIELVHVNYKAAGLAFNDLISGQVELMFPNVDAVAPHVRSGRLRALAVTSAEPSALAPGLPTMAASGLPGYESVAQNALLAPAKTPLALITRLNQDSVRYLQTADIKQKLFSAGTEVLGTSPQECAAAIKADIARWKKVIADIGLHVGH
jgi:tripartite-type tricarboxylate transporter receptor subunit TctC